MRFIGYLEDPSLAEQLASLLRAQGIQHLVEPDDGRRWSVWVVAEDDTERARRLLGDFVANPTHPAFHLPPVLTSVRPTPTTTPPPPPPRARRIDPVHPYLLESFLPYVTTALIILCGVVALMTGLGTRPELIRWLLISETPYRLGASMALFLPEVRHGEVWRLLSPAVLHFGWPHILFNLWAFWDLGNLIERRQGPSRFLTLVIGLALISNLGQYLAAGPRFGGMSGVIYGLLGYAWMMGRYRPEAGIGLHPQSVVMMLVWFVICLSDALGVPVANAAHGFGLIAGIFWGRFSARFG